MKYESRERWYRAEKQDAPRVLISECEKAIQDNGQRRAEALLYATAPASATAQFAAGPSTMR
jgi:hypothetical protein